MHAMQPCVRSETNCSGNNFKSISQLLLHATAQGHSHIQVSAQCSSHTCTPSALISACSAHAAQAAAITSWCAQCTVNAAAATTSKWPMPYLLGGFAALCIATAATHSANTLAATTLPQCVTACCDCHHHHSNIYGQLAQGFGKQ